eukprot:COSAG06_NODE_780_length_12362_cov_44.967142_10_plen_121_part_00
MKNEEEGEILYIQKLQEIRKEEEEEEGAFTLSPLATGIFQGTPAPNSSSRPNARCCPGRHHNQGPSGRIDSLIFIANSLKRYLGLCVKRRIRPMDEFQKVGRAERAGRKAEGGAITVSHT